jgi:glyceraldehyde-3-phosphate dehydrogenase (NAD(P))
MTIDVGVNGYGVIGKRVVSALSQQDDMQCGGVAEINPNAIPETVVEDGVEIYVGSSDYREEFEASGIPTSGGLAELLDDVDVIVDCTPKKVASKNVEVYREAGVKFIVQGGESHDLTGHSFVASSNYSSALDRNSTRVVSCNTTSVVRTLTALKKAGILNKARGTLLRRATDPWESHKSGIMNTLVPEPDIPSHQGPDAQHVDSELDVVTMAVKTPQTLSHLHYWTVELTQNRDPDRIIDIFRTNSRIVPIRMEDGFVSNNTLKERMLDIGRPRGDMYEVALWTDMLTVEGNELYYAYVVDNQAIVIPETIDAIRALTGLETEPDASIQKTNDALDIGTEFVPVSRTGGGK